MSALWEYYCQVPVNGYEVITDDEWGAKIQARSKQTKRVDLFKASPSAFLEFAQTPATEDRIKDFADRYGPLFPAGDVIKFWSEEIRTMHRTVELWNMSKKTGDFRKLISVVPKTFLKVGWVDEEHWCAGRIVFERRPVERRCDTLHSSAYLVSRTLRSARLSD